MVVTGIRSYIGRGGRHMQDLEVRREDQTEDGGYGVPGSRYPLPPHLHRSFQPVQPLEHFHHEVSEDPGLCFRQVQA